MFPGEHDFSTRSIWTFCQEKNIYKMCSSVRVCAYVCLAFCVYIGGSNIWPKTTCGLLAAKGMRIGEE